jgi:hypothetical protein
MANTVDMIAENNNIPVESSVKIDMKTRIHAVRHAVTVRNFADLAAKMDHHCRFKTMFRSSVKLLIYSSIDNSLV